MPLPPESDRRSPETRGYGQGYAYFGMALTVVAAMLAFGAAGWALDGWLGTRPLFAVAGAMLGGYLGFMSIYYRVKRETGKKEEGRGKSTP